jgi:hypothetical protein
MAATFADDFRDLILAAFEFTGERVIALRLFHRIEVFALNVFMIAISSVATVDVDRYDWHLVQAGDLRCVKRRSPHDFVAILHAANRLNHDRLDHAVLLGSSRRVRQVRHREIHGVDCADWV